MPWSKASVPSGFLYCDGSAVSRTTYADLFAVIGTTFGNPDASNFNLPDFTDRAAIGASNNRGFAAKNNTALADQTPNISFPSANKNVSVSDNFATANANVPLQAHTHFISTNDTSNATGQASATANNQVALSGSISDTNFRYGFVASNNTAVRGKTSSAGSGNGSHSHTINGSASGSFNQSNLTANASAIDIENPYLAIRYLIRF